MVDTKFELSCKDCGSLLFKSDIEYSYDDFGKFFYVKIYCLTCGRIREDKKMISETMARMSKKRIKGGWLMDNCNCENLRFSTEISDRGTEFNVVECLDCDYVCVS